MSNRNPGLPGGCHDHLKVAALASVHLKCHKRLTWPTLLLLASCMKGVCKDLTIEADSLADRLSEVTEDLVHAGVLGWDFSGYSLGTKSFSGNPDYEALTASAEVSLCLLRENAR